MSVKGKTSCKMQTLLLHITKREAVLHVSVEIIFVQNVGHAVLYYVPGYPESVFTTNVNPFPNKSWFLRVCGTKAFESTAGKGEFARNEQFLLFPQCFLPVWRAFCHFHQIWKCRLQTLWNWKSLKFIVWERVRYPDPEDRIFNHVISDISVVLRETTLTISDSIESEIVRAVFLSTTEITEIIRFKKNNLQGEDSWKLLPDEGY